MKSACEKLNNCTTHTTSPVFELSTRLPGYLETGTPWFSVCVAGEKNNLRGLRMWASDVLRSQGSSGAGSFLRGSACLAGGGGSPSLVSKVREGEAGAFGLAGRQSLLHEAFCLLGGAAVSCLDDSRCCPGDPSGLEDGQGAGEAVHDGATAAGGYAGTSSGRDRRTVDSQGAYISDRGERFDSKAPHLVWGHGPFGSEHGFVL